MLIKNPRIFKQVLWHLLLLAMIFITLYPLVFMVSASFKTNVELFSSGLHILPSSPTLVNFNAVFSKHPVVSFILNSLVIASIVTIAKVITSVLTSYALVFMDLKYKEVIFYIFTLTMFVPFSVIMIPNYLTINKLGLMNKLVGVALPQLADAMGIFRIRQAMRQIPKSLVESARIEKVNHFTTLLRIVIPLVRSSIVAMSIIFFINSWNEFIWPMLILKSREKSTVTIALHYFLNSEGGSAWGSSMALATIATIVPLFLYLISQRQIISTFLQSGLKE
ncbi:MAG: L-arabinose transport system permease protein AraQ [Chloroflexi bacterium ADurb.Bin120]|jgi:sn-glycerol 3-phosphate transport system permease protein|uniref:ABC transmembrane type-1 domain-containing protein n=1 Tax=Candidatus Brevifilum fermentans TaxID=1986204 RepID=A0A1Y6K9P9_9CHLR|nr:carbohydrate ABC transporter permease [Brevefilum fermentans]OQB83818.1 MAG: L-arabinose transport system permease protein AraQ [Chloroflexi bacterium ADurb.Bin120]SMX55299.1 conserved membrane protein of unknown function [Brevefilum fermentans]HOM66791.1 carbohydrate ABC transporter permease [Brevefilum fermentans]